MLSAWKQIDLKLGVALEHSAHLWGTIANDKYCKVFN